MFYLVCAGQVLPNRSPATNEIMWNNGTIKLVIALLDVSLITVWNVLFFSLSISDVLYNRQNHIMLIGTLKALVYRTRTVREDSRVSVSSSMDMNVSVCIKLYKKNSPKKRFQWNQTHLLKLPQITNQHNNYYHNYITGQDTLLLPKQTY